MDSDPSRVSEGPSRRSLGLRVGEPASGEVDAVELLDGGARAYPRMLLAIAQAQESVHLEVYAFAHVGIGEAFVAELARAARRGVRVQVQVDGWGSSRDANAVAAALREAGCRVRIYNRLSSLLIGRLGRNHRKLLLVDDSVAFVGGINIGNENLGDARHPGWADLALEIHGPQCAQVGRLIRREPARPVHGNLRVFLCGLGGGWRMRREYVRAFQQARERILVAHGYFVPDRGIVRALVAAARRGVEVDLLLAGRSDVPFARMATRSLHRRLLAAGVRIHEWDDSVLHAKVAAIDTQLLLLGSFNLDAFSLANLEALVRVDDPEVARQAEAWIRDHLEGSRPVTAVESASLLSRRLLDPIGRLLARLADELSRLMARRRRRRAVRARPDSPEP